MSDELKAMFRLHAVASFLLGVPLVLFPGPFLGAFGWAPVDPILSRLAGAAILASGWSSFRALQADSPRIAVILIEMEGVFCVIGAIALLRVQRALELPSAPL